MKWRWTAAIIIGLFIFAIGLYLILDPEVNELNEGTRSRLGGTYVRLSDGVTHYKLEGPLGARVAVLVHGATIPIWTWDAQARALSRAGFRVLSYDNFGRGYSDRPDVTYDQELYLKQLKELVDRLGLIEPFDLIGLSLGGGTAVNFTARYPDRVDKLVLISPLVNNFKVPSFFGIPVLGEFLARLAGIRVIVNRFSSLEGVGHGIVFQKPEVVNHLITDFLLN